MISRPSLAKRSLAMSLAVTVVLALSTTPPDSASATPSSTPNNGQDTLFVIGDSLTVGTQAFGQLQMRLDRIGIWDRAVIDAKVGRRADQSVGILQKKLPATASAIVIALGTNDVISRREPSYPSLVINKVMASSHGLPVLWVNTDFSPTGRGDWRFRSRRFNRALRGAQEQWNNLVVADWYNYFSPKGKTRFQSDGVHLSVSAYKLRARFFETQIKQFGEAIVNATTTTTTVMQSTTTTVTPTTTLPETTTSTSSTTTSTTTTSTLP